MCEPSRGDMLFTDLLRDPLTRLLMRSDGVTKRDMIVLGRRVRGALAARCNVDNHGSGDTRPTRSDPGRTTTIGGAA